MPHNPLSITAVDLVTAEIDARSRYSFVRIRTEAGITGYGEPSPSAAATTPAVVERQLRPLLVGQDAFQLERLWEAMYLGTYKVRGQATSIAISGVDNALHDLVGKALRVPVYQLLGGLYRERVRMYASFMYRDLEPVEMARRAAAAVEQGFTGVKIKIGVRHGFDAGPDNAVEMVREVRQAIGADAELMVDANSAYSVHHAIRVGRRLEEYAVFHFEEPIPFTDVAGTAAVAAALDIPVAGGEQDHTRYDFQKLLAAEAVDIVQADVTKAGGLSECKRIAALTDARGKYYTPHDTSTAFGLAACLHLVASTPCCRYAQEYSIASAGAREALFAEPLRVEDGYITVPNRPGLGLELSERFAELR
jgi:L-alanine-DL-glutamate epimerase-like enolase superfamily enzyme